MKKLNIVYAQGYFAKQAKKIVMEQVKVASEKHNVIMSPLIGNKNNLSDIKAPIDIYHCHSGFSLESMKLAKKLGAKIILQRDSAHVEMMIQLIENDCGNWRGNPEYKGLCDINPRQRTNIKSQIDEYDLADHILVASNWERDTLLEFGVDPTKLQWIIPFTADCDKFKPAIKPMPFKVCLGGNMCIRKGYPYAKEACKLAGVPLDVIQGVPFENMPNALRDYTVCLAPTIEDGYPHQVLASMATGLVPIVSTNTGTKDLIADGHNGFVIDMMQPNAIKKIAKILTKLKENDIWCNQIGSNARNTIKEWSWDDYSKAICMFYEEVI